MARGWRGVTFIDRVRQASIAARPHWRGAMAGAVVTAATAGRSWLGAMDRLHRVTDSEVRRGAMASGMDLASLARRAGMAAAYVAMVLAQADLATVGRAR